MGDGAGDTRPACLSARVREVELAEPPYGVLEAAGAGDAPAADAEEVHLGDVDEPPACRWVAEPGAGVGPGTDEPADGSAGHPDQMARAFLLPPLPASPRAADHDQTQDGGGDP